MGIVEIQAVDQHAIDERGIADRQAVGAADNAAAADPAERGGAGQGGVREAVGVRGNAAAKRIENQELGPLQDGGRDVLEGEPAGELAQGAGRRGCCGQVIRHGLSSVRGWGRIRPQHSAARRDNCRYAEAATEKRAKQIEADGTRLPRTARQRCLAHKVCNLQSKVPETSGLRSTPAPFRCYQAASPARETRIPIRPVLVGYRRHRRSRGYH